MSYTRILMILGLFLSITATHAATTGVYCVHSQDSSAWYWLADGNYRISGTVKYFKYQNETYTGFSVKEQDYQAAKKACYEGWYPQPADTRFSNWRNFLVKTTSQHGHDWRLAPGFISENHFITEMLAPSTDFNPCIQCTYVYTRGTSIFSSEKRSFLCK